MQCEGESGRTGQAYVQQVPVSCAKIFEYYLHSNNLNCNSGIIDGEPLRFRGEVYHGYHFKCTTCNVELDSTAREVKSRPGFVANDMNELYCLRCHDKMGIPICGACRRPIEERVVTALGKHWHVEVSMRLIVLKVICLKNMLGLSTLSAQNARNRFWVIGTMRNVV